MGCWFDKPLLQNGLESFFIIRMAKMLFLQNGLQAHSNSTFNINTSEGVCSHYVETNSWGVHCVHTHFVVGAHFILQNGVHNPTRSIGMLHLIDQLDGFTSSKIDSSFGLDFIARLRDGPRHPAHLSVHAGDRIIAVNGFSEDAEASEKKHQGQRGSDVRNFRKKIRNKQILVQNYTKHIQIQRHLL